MDAETGLYGCVHFQNCIMTNLTKKKKTGFLKRLCAQLEWDWTNVKVLLHTGELSHP